MAPLNRDTLRERGSGTNKGKRALLIFLAAWTIAASIVFLVWALDVGHEQLIIMRWPAASRLSGLRGAVKGIPAVDRGRGAGKEASGSGSPAKVPGESRMQRLMRLAHRRWQGCPDWIPQYASMHRGILGEGSKGRFMLHSCGEKTALYCAGLGDRIRAMMETLRLAKYAGR